jgi:hypothetical protein
MSASVKVLFLLLLLLSNPAQAGWDEIFKRWTWRAWSAGKTKTVKKVRFLVEETKTDEERSPGNYEKKVKSESEALHLNGFDLVSKSLSECLKSHPKWKGGPGLSNAPIAYIGYVFEETLEMMVGEIRTGKMSRSQLVATLSDRLLESVVAFNENTESVDYDIFPEISKYFFRGTSNIAVLEAEYTQKSWMPGEVKTIISYELSTSELEHVKIIFPKCFEDSSVFSSLNTYLNALTLE